ncbi:MAG: hypothetical protein GX381_03090 [Synergistaceae bacterium]|nr:hypothetical protein [Synergistaceae bacterium]
MNYLVIFGKPRFLGLLTDLEQEIDRGTNVVIESARGLEIADVVGILSEEQLCKYKERFELPKESEASDNDQLKSTEPPLQYVKLMRFADELDVSDAKWQRQEEDEALPMVRKMLKNHSLPMKIVDMEYLLDRKKLYFYFTSEQRVDFRCFVKELAKEFKTRIELRQIGARDEAKILGGLAPCGNPCCCSYWMLEFLPICIRMVKEQNLALNPSKISGLCGRLMCCMSYEYDMYSELWKDLPNPGTKIKTSSGNYQIAGVDIVSKSVRIKSPEGVEFLVPISEFKLFKKTVEGGEKWNLHVNLADQAEAHNLFGKEVFALKGSCSELDESLEKDCDECSAHRPKAKGKNSGRGRSFRK